MSKRKTVDELYDEIMADPNNKVNFISNYFSLPIDEDEVAIEQIKVNLLDPFTWNLIDTPARGIKCNHGQCFDLKTFLGFMNVQKNRNWKCPTCSKECRRFYIDSQQMEVIKQFRKENQSRNLSKEVTFHRDGRTLFNIQDESDAEGTKKNNDNQGSMVDEDRERGNQKRQSEVK